MPLFTYTARDKSGKTRGINRVRAAPKPKGKRSGNREKDLILKGRMGAGVKGI